MDNVKDKPTVRTHEQVSLVERKRMPRGLSERANKNRAAYMPARAWTNRKDERERGRVKFHVPEWLLPKNGVHVFHTLTASIVWGICGKMADVPEYETSCPSIL